MASYDTDSFSTDAFSTTSHDMEAAAAETGDMLGATRATRFRYGFRIIIFLLLGL